MSNTVFIIDRSDLRNSYLKKMFETEGYMVFDFEENLYYTVAESVYIFPPSKLIDINISRKIRPHSKVFLLNITEEAKNDFLIREIEYFDILDDEIFAHKNAMLTAEGALSIIIGNTEKSLLNLNLTVLGLGRVGKSMCNILKKLGANVIPVTTTEEEKLTSTLYITDEYLTLENFGEYLNKFNVIINTIPARILEENLIEKMRPDAFVLDLASKPGGIDLNLAAAHNINAINALGIPAKATPYDAGRFLKERILRSLNKQGG